jgi:hypothetical protein
MGLPVRQRRVLDHIECALRGSDPKLAALYAIFARLNAGEEMPRLEQLRHRAVVVTARVRLRVAFVMRRVFRRVMPRQPAVLFFPLTLALVAVSIVFAALSSPGRGCPPISPLAAGPHRPPSKLCKTTAVNPFTMPPH